MAAQRCISLVVAIAVAVLMWWTVEQVFHTPELRAILETYDEVPLFGVAHGLLLSHFVATVVFVVVYRWVYHPSRH